MYQCQNECGIYPLMQLVCSIDKRIDFLAATLCPSTLNTKHALFSDSYG